jgi:phenylacetyl-CoA:acceptor oxidoreductase
MLREGVRPDVAVALQQFGHWATPFAKELAMPNLNQLCPMGLAFTDGTGRGADLVKAKIYPLSGQSLVEE